MEPTNPYQAPAAAVVTAESSSRAIIRPARRVRAGRGGSWLNDGFVSTGQSIVGWTLVLIPLALLYVGVVIVGEALGTISFVLSFLPSLLLYPLLTMVWGGVMLACHDGPLTFRKVLNGALAHRGPLMFLGVLSGLLSFASLIPWVFLSTTNVFSPTPSVSGGGVVILIFLYSMLIFGLVMAAMWFAPALVAIGRVSPWQSLKRSFTACFKNFIPFTVFSLLVFVLAIAAVLLVVLIFAMVAGVLGFATSFEGLDGAVGIAGVVFGLLFYAVAAFVMISVTGAAQYASFKDVFAYDATT